MDKVVSIQGVSRHQRWHLPSSPAVGTQEDGEVSVCTIGDSRGARISGPSNSLWHCCCTASPGDNLGRKALFCVPQGPVNSVPGGMWPQGLLPILQGQENYPQTLPESSALVSLSYPSASPQSFSPCSLLPISLPTCRPQTLGSCGPLWPASEHCLSP